MKSSHRIGLAVGLCIAAATLVPISPVQAVPNCSPSQADGDFNSQPSLQDILNEANGNCDSVEVSFTTGFTLDSDAIIWEGSEPITLTGDNPTGTVLDGAGQFRVFQAYSATNVTIQDLTMTNGAADGNGGAIIVGGALELDGVAIKDSTAASSSAPVYGGGVFASGAVEVTASEISGNTAQGASGNECFGGGIYSDSTVSITDSDVSANLLTNSTSGARGGGVVGAAGVTVSGSLMSGNSVEANEYAAGGAISSQAPVTIEDSAISLNSTTSSTDVAAGGGAANFDLMTVTNSSVTSNSATAPAGSVNGAGIAAVDASVTNSTIAQNLGSAGGVVNGAGAYAVTSVDLKFSTVADNSATAGTSQGRDLQAPSITTIGSVIASPSGDSCANATVSGSATYNVTRAGDNSCGMPGSPNLQGTWAEINLGLLRPNGTLTSTMAPQDPSILIAAVPNATGQNAIGPNATDQRGVTRVGDFWIGAEQSATVTFDGNNGGGAMGPQTQAAPGPLDSNTFSRSDYTFGGWNTAADGTGTAYADGADFDFRSTVTMYAQWTPIPVPPTPTQTSQSASCFNSPLKPRRSIIPVTRADCRTNASQIVGTKMSFKAKRGDVTNPRLACVVNGRLVAPKRLPASYGRSYYCKKGPMVIVTSGHKGRFTVTWKAPATATYKAFVRTRNVKI